MITRNIDVKAERGLHEEESLKERFSLIHKHGLIHFKTSSIVQMSSEKSRADSRYDTFLYFIETKRSDSTVLLQSICFD